MSEVRKLGLLGLVDFLLLFGLIRVLVEVLEILVTRQLRDPWRLNTLLLNNVPVDALEPCLGLDVFGAAAQAPQPLGQVLLEQAGDQRAARHRDTGWELVVPDRDPLVNVVRIGVIERRIPVKMVNTSQNLP